MLALRNAGTHPGQPAPWQALLVAVVEAGHDFVLEEAVEHVRFRAVPAGVRAVLLAIAEGPADLGAPGLGPPAVELRQI